MVLNSAPRKDIYCLSSCRLQPTNVPICMKCGLDFVELPGGTMEKLAFKYMRDSTRKREAFFLEFAEKIHPVFRRTVVYVTDGWRTAPAMVRAAVDGTTDGKGLGRPITAESDLSEKILRGECYSAANTELDQDDFIITSTARNTQMGQMGKRPYAELKVDDEIAEKYLKDAFIFCPQTEKEIQKSMPNLNAEWVKAGSAAGLSPSVMSELKIELPVCLVLQLLDKTY
uniref:DDE-1 domain-containing protein n=1 Tax=Angiostrongylus cantonensis TaxID=6313 RepID=A0A0K0D3U3_ANGCA